METKQKIVNKYLQKDAYVTDALKALVSIGAMRENFVAVRIQNTGKEKGLNIEGVTEYYDIYSFDSGKAPTSFDGLQLNQIVSEQQVLTNIGVSRGHRLVEYELVGVDDENEKKTNLTLYFKKGHLNIMRLHGMTEVYNSINVDMLVDLYKNRRPG